MQRTYEATPAEGSYEAQRSDPAPSNKGRPEHAWLSNLMRELFQTERSAKEHPTVEAERLGDVPPAHAMRAVAEHAEAALADLPRLAKAHDLPDSAGGEAAGKALSILRDTFGDLLLSVEKSYRGTLLGMRHGVDLVELIREVAHGEGIPELAAWCSAWLDRRRPLVEAAAKELAWFATHPDRATEPAKTGKLASSVQAIAEGCEGLAETITGRATRSS